jgi:hypothetical protein
MNEDPKAPDADHFKEAMIKDILEHNKRRN